MPVLKFVIQKHTRGDDVHWDLMLESGDSLKTWRIAVPPEDISEQPTPATKIFDHPLKFLTYEGTVNQGKGSVCIADSGTYQIIQESDNEIKFSINGKLLHTALCLTLTEKNLWLLTNQKE